MSFKKLLIILHLVFVMLSSSIAVASSLDEGKTAFDNGDYSAAVELLLPLAIDGNGYAQYRMGYMYAVGKGVQRSHKKKLEWYERAAKSGYVPAFSSTARAYQMLGGESSLSGPTQESEAYHKQAFKWYSKAADAGSSSGLHGLAQLYNGGYGVKRNHPQAIAYYTDAAMLGNTFSQFSLAMELAHDYRMSGNIIYLEQAYKWLKIHAFYDTEDADTYAKDSFSRAQRYKQYKNLTRNQVSRITQEAINCVVSNFKEC
ncbi:sel1 repeat family protein [Oceanospirillaceae bacterium]|nr:sel1 repeat family protein [Oceanospirillaceae bacterium]